MTAPIAPMRLRGPYAADQAVRDAMNAALHGDFLALDRLEVTYLNVLVRIGELFVKDASGTPYWWFDPSTPRFADLERDGLAPFVTAYHRHGGPAGEPAVEWWLAPKCRRCAGLLRRLECRVCGGDWYVADAADHVVYTNSDGVVLELAC